MCCTCLWNIENPKIVATMEKGSTRVLAKTVKLFESKIWEVKIRQIRNMIHVFMYYEISLRYINKIRNNEN